MGPLFPARLRNSGRSPPEISWSASQGSHSHRDTECHRRHQAQPRNGQLSNVLTKLQSSKSTLRGSRKDNECQMYGRDRVADHVQVCESEWDCLHGLTKERKKKLRRVFRSKESPPGTTTQASTPRRR